MIILGIGGSTHDLSYCLIKDGVIIGAIEEERISREKHCVGIRSTLFNGIEYCLKQHGIAYNDIDIFISNNLFLGRVNLPFNTSILRINHHLTHACSSYYNSGFDESAVLVIDGCGDNYIHKKVETISCGYASGKKINIFETIQGDIKSIFSDDS